MRKKRVFGLVSESQIRAVMTFLKTDKLYVMGLTHMSRGNIKPLRNHASCGLSYSDFCLCHSLSLPVPPVPSPLLGSHSLFASPFFHTHDHKILDSRPRSRGGRKFHKLLDAWKIQWKVDKVRTCVIVMNSRCVCACTCVWELCIKR